MSNFWCSKCQRETESYRDSQKRERCAPCRDQWEAKMWKLIDHRKTLLCLMCGDLKGQQLGGHFYGEEGYTCEKCLTCSYCNKGFAEEVKIFHGTEGEKVAHLACFSKRK